MKNIVKILTTLIAIKSIHIDDESYFQDLASILKLHNFHIEIFESSGTYNLYSEFLFNKNSSDIDLAFVGHLDVVPPGDENNWTFDPFKLESSKGFFYGRGAVDMKSSIAAFIQAVIDFTKNDSKNNLNLAIIITGDEETNSHGANQLINFLSKRNKKIKQILIGEPTSDKKFGDVVKNGRRGSANFNLVIYGVQGHVAYPDKAKNPIDILGNLINELINYRIDEGNESFQPSRLVITSIDVDNNARNIIPAEVKIKFNIRYNNLQNIESLKEIIFSIIEKEIKEYRYELKVISNSNSFYCPSNRFSDLLMESIEEVSGVKSVVNTDGGTSDGRILYKIAPIIEFGPLNETAHKVDEKISHDDLESLYKIYLKVLTKLSG